MHYLTYVTPGEAIIIISLLVFFIVFLNFTKTSKMNTQEAVQAIKDLTTKVQSYEAKVTKLVQAAANAGEIPTEVSDAIAELQAETTTLGSELPADDAGSDTTEQSNG